MRACLLAGTLSVTLILGGCTPNGHMIMTTDLEVYPNCQIQESVTMSGTEDFGTLVRNVPSRAIQDLRGRGWSVTEEHQGSAASLQFSRRHKSIADYQRNNFAVSWDPYEGGPQQTLREMWHPSASLTREATS